MDQERKKDDQISYMDVPIEVWENYLARYLTKKDKLNLREADKRFWKRKAFLTDCWFTNSWMEDTNWVRPGEKKRLAYKSLFFKGIEVFKALKRINPQTKEALLAFPIPDTVTACLVVHYGVRMKLHYFQWLPEVFRTDKAVIGALFDYPGRFDVHDYDAVISKEKKFLSNAYQDLRKHDQVATQAAERARNLAKFNLSDIGQRYLENNQNPDPETLYSMLSNGSVAEVMHNIFSEQHEKSDQALEAFFSEWLSRQQNPLFVMKVFFFVRHFKPDWQVLYTRFVAKIQPLEYASELTAFRVLLSTIDGPDEEDRFLLSLATDAVFLENPAHKSWIQAMVAQRAVQSFLKQVGIDNHPAIQALIQNQARRVP